MTRSLARLADIAYRRRGRMVLVWIAATIVIIGLGSSLKGEYEADYNTPGSESKAASELTEREFGGYSGQEVFVVWKDPDGANSPAARERINAFFTEAELKPYGNMEAAREALRKGEADLLFGDGIALAFWLNGTDSAGCCMFVGGPFTESRYFGEGVGIAVKRGNDTLRLAFNWALFRLWEKGRFTDLWLRYFPISPF